MMILTLPLFAIFLTTAAGQMDSCFHEGQSVVLSCVVPAQVGVLTWGGVGFECPNIQSIENNQLSFLTYLSTEQQHCIEVGSCNFFHGNLSCLENGSLISNLYFVVDYSMNGGQILCMHRDTVKNISLLVGVIPDSPSNSRVRTLSENVLHYKWDPPKCPVVGGILGYELTANKDCGRCTPIGTVDNNTFDSLCTGWNNQSDCQFEIQTITADCSFHSAPADITQLPNIACSSFEPPEHGQLVYHSCETGICSMVSVLCDEGYSNFGPKNFTCHSSGYWNQDPSSANCIEVHGRGDNTLSSAELAAGVCASVVALVVGFFAGLCVPRLTSCKKTKKTVYSPRQANVQQPIASQELALNNSEIIKYNIQTNRAYNPIRKL